ncbi:MAG: MFS transporter [Planctomycetes bacterium]|nr:MFS transporter [Planctomycetota bacterium]
MSLAAQVKSMRWPFWVVNFMEMIERLAYNGVRTVIPIYIAQADEPAGLHFTQAQKGTIFMVWAFVQTALPVFTGGFADRYGYKKQIAIAIVLKIIGYMLMATQREFGSFLAGCIILAAGTAVFKPPIQGTMAKTLDEKTSGTGWGLFYMVVNVGGFLGPPLAHFLYGISWPAVFYGCAAIVSLNFLWLFSYGTVESGTERTKGIWHVVVTTAKELTSPRLLAFIAIMSAFWACFMQLFDMLPNFIVDWVDSSALAKHLPALMIARDAGRGPQIAQEWVINFNPFLIVLFVVPISWYVNERMRRLSSIVLGIVIASLGILVTGSSMSIFICLGGIAMFSVGEMLSSPKMNEYLAVIAPKDKKGLYMGYANIPVAIGWSYGSLAGGQIYERAGEKAALALRYLAEHVKLEALPDRTLAFEKLCGVLEKTPAEVTGLLWKTYHPSQVWIPFAIAGFAAAFAMIIFSRLARRWSDMGV